MNYLVEPLKNLADYQKLLDSIDNFQSPIYLNGLIKESLGHFIYSLYSDRSKTTLVVAEDEIQAKTIYEAVSTIDSDIVEYYPAKEINYYNIESIEDDIEKSRIKVMSRLIKKDKFIIITTPFALQRKITKKSAFKNSSIKIDEDSIVDLDLFTQSLRHLQYERVSTIESKGQFAIRGGIIDIFPIQMESPVRLELFDDEVDTIRTFNIETQRSIENIKSFEITPCREMIFTEKQVEKIKKGLKKDIEKVEEFPKYGIDNEKLIEKFRKILEYLENDLYISNTDFLIPYLTKTDYDLLQDYLPKESIIFVEDMARVYDRNSDIIKSYMTEMTYQVEKGEVFEKHEKVLAPISDIISKIKEHIAINSTSLLKKTRLLSPVVKLEIDTTEATNYNKNFELLIESVREHSYQGYKTVIFAGSKAKAESLYDLLIKENIPVGISTDLNMDIKTSQVIISDMNMNSGFEYKDIKYLFITHKEIYGRGRAVNKRRAKKRTARDIIQYSDLAVDDFVVHESYGVGQYKGIEQIEVSGIIKDYIIIQYRGNDKLFIPIDQMNMVQKYIGGDSSKPKINKLGGADWAKAKAKTKKAVDEIANYLVELYAKREKLKGYKFSSDTQWQREFEDSFIYEETDSQLRSIAEIKADMESERPMDRLLCGDVGYGKTEVAIRAAFKAVMDGKQVAFLVPTTILAQQHYNTIVERFKNYPVSVEMLSRFRTKKQQDKIFKDLEKGLVDIVIGTHRLLSDKLNFKDLGLLIIDEEQRFGVKHKEKLKIIKENVDVLTLSATPIPRTLQMGLAGVRDMSLLDDPPQERSPITTYVLEYNPQIIRDAIYREINRGGQIYFVYNNIERIDEMKAELQKLVPEASIDIAHGRMTERALENVMMDFIDGEFDILLSTTIIETGLDIQNVNTMVVYNADKMGLAQLYQLKGRIGRGDRTSSAYFTYDKNKALTEIAEKRLMAIKDFTEFGSGFKIAMRDLELRGAGNLLGESQHGHIASVGYDLYIKLLEEAIKEVKGETLEDNKTKLEDISVEIKIDGYIPDDYITDTNEKIDMYKRIASLRDEEEYSDLVEELIDRFGDLPKSVQNIMDIAIIKSLASKVGFSRIKEQSKNLRFEFEDKDLIDINTISYLTKNFDGELSFDLSQKPSIKLAFERKNLKEPIEFLQVLNNLKVNENDI